MELMAKAGRRSAAAACFALLVLLSAATPGRAAAALDPAFGDGGISVPGLEFASLYDITEDAKGRLVGVGDMFSSFLAARFSKAGALDPTFGSDTGYSGSGYMVSNLGIDSLANAVATQPDGKIVAVGSSKTGSFILARYAEAGSRDAGFGEDGRVGTAIGRRGGGAEAVTLLPNGRILVAGDGIDLRRRWEGVVAAYQPNGALDPKFGSDGMVHVTTEGEWALQIEAMKVLASGKILLAGDLAGRILVLRLHPNGAVDRSFGGDGQVSFDIDGGKDCPCAYATGMALDRRGRIVVSANIVRGKREPAALLRLLPNGRRDPGFGEEGMVRTVLGSRLAGKDVVVQKNRRILLAGHYNVPGSGEARVAVVRYRPDGGLDRSFARRGFFTHDFGREGVAYAAHVQRDGRVVVAGREIRDPLPQEGPSSFIWDVFLMRFLP